MKYGMSSARSNALGLYSPWNVLSRRCRRRYWPIPRGAKITANSESWQEIGMQFSERELFSDSQRVCPKLLFYLNRSRRGGTGRAGSASLHRKTAGHIKVPPFSKFTYTAIHMRAHTLGLLIPIVVSSFFAHLDVAVCQTATASGDDGSAV